MLGFACAGFRRLRLVLWLFPSGVWDVLWCRILVKNILFLEQNRNFPKLRWVRSKNVFLSSGGLVALVVTKKAALTTCSDRSTWNNTCFSFKCRVTFRLRQFSKATFGILALYILRSRRFVISNTYKNGFFLEENNKFPKRPWVRSKNDFLSSGGLDSLVVTKSCFENLLRSLYMK